MEGMSEREYSGHSGLSRGAIQKARKAGRLVYGDGSINAAASDARRAEMERSGSAAAARVAMAGCPARPTARPISRPAPR